ncbi:MAG: hypothetical protein AAF438_17110 [Pseudomonadota bacterium]
MNWEAAGAIGEIVGGVAVLVTLIYLAVQVRQAKSQLNLAAYQEAEKLFSEPSNALSASPELAKAIAMASSDKHQDLEEWQELMVDAHLTALLNAWELTISQSDSGILMFDRGEILKIFGRVVTQSWVVHSWHRIRWSWSEEMQSLVDAYIAADSNSSE